MGLGKNHALLGELVDAGGFDFAVLGVEALHIPVAEVIAHDENDVWFFGCESAQSRECDGT